MGNFIKNKQRLDYATMAIKFVENNDVIRGEEECRSYDSDNPIHATIEVESDRPIAAYGIQVSFVRLEKTRYIDDDNDIKQNRVTYQ